MVGVMAGRIVLVMPPAWWDDATSRELDIGVELRRTKRGVTVEMTPAQMAEARSAADYDKDLVSMSGDMSFGGLASSARAALARIDLVAKAVRP